MDAAAVSATVLPLVGVLLGTAGTLTGQYLATRGEGRRHDEQRAAQARAERKEAIVGFLDAVQRVERVVDDRTRGQPPEPATVDDFIHQLWLAKKLLELVCSADVASAAHRYTNTLHTLARADSTDAPPTGRPTGELAVRQWEYRGEFMEASRRELGIDGPRLYRPPTGPIDP